MTIRGLKIKVSEGARSRTKRVKARGDQTFRGNNKVSSNRTQGLEQRLQGHHNFGLLTSPLDQHWPPRLRGINDAAYVKRRGGGMKATYIQELGLSLVERMMCRYFHEYLLGLICRLEI